MSAARPMLAAAALATLMAPAAIAAPPFDDLDAVRLEPLGVPAPVGFPTFVGEDADGYLYWQMTSPPRLLCHHPDDPVATERTLEGAVGMSVTGLPALWLGGKRTFSCAAAQALGGPGALLTEVTGELPVEPPRDAAHLAFGADGTVCAGDTGETTTAQDTYHTYAWIDCWAPGATAWTRRFDTGTLDATLGFAVFDMDYAGQAPSAREGWRLRDMLVLDGGRLLVWVVRDTNIASEGVGSYLWHVPRTFILELGPDGEVRARAGTVPPLRDPAGTDLVGAVDLLASDAAAGAVLRFEPTLGLVLIGPLRDTEYSQDIITWPGDPATNTPPYDAPRGPGGDTFMALDPDGPGLGTLSLTNALWTACAGDMQHDCERTIVLHEVGGRTLFASSLYRPVADAGVHRVVLDPARLDLDGDGLLGADEDALGTSDLLSDSDFGGASDAAEAALLASDPTHPGDDAPPGLVRDETIAMSALVRFALGDDARTSWAPIRSYAADAPLCMAAGGCRDAAGRTVGAVPNVGPVSAIAADGRHLVTLAPDGLVAIDILRGDEHLVVAPDDPLYPIDREAWQLVPLDGTRAFITRATPGEVRFLEEGQPIRTLFSVAGACGAAPCREHVNDGLTDEPLGELRLSGLAPDGEALLVSVPTTWRVVVLALAPSGDVTPVHRRSGAMAWPDYLVPFGPRARGLAWGAAWDWTRTYSTIGSVFDPALRVFAQPTHGLWDTGTRVPIAAWDGTLIAEPTAEWFGPVELVRLEATLAPGDVLGWSGWDDHVGVSRASLRGGLAQVVRVDALDPWHAPDQVTGVGLAPDHTLCVANPTLGVVREYQAAHPLGVPQLFLMDVEAPGAVDCAYDADGTLRVVSRATGAQPARVWRRPARILGAPLEVDATIDAGADPIAFVVEHDGSLSVLDRADGLCARLPLRSGDELTVRCGDDNVYWNGLPLALDRRDAETTSVANPRVTFDGSLGGVELAERPDGRIAIAAHQHFVLDLRTGRVVRDRIFTYGLHALAVVPGGAALDPWSGEPLGDIVPRLSAEATPPPTPPAPGGGSPAPRVQLGTIETCAGAGSGSTLLALLAALAALAFIAGRRRA